MMVSSITSSAGKVGSSDDLLLEILLRLPMKSLLRLKSVSKHWCSVISDPRFARRWRPTSSPSGLFFHWFSLGYASTSLPHFDFIPLENNEKNSSAYPNLLFFPYIYDITFMNSTNGLVCCVACSKLEAKVSYHVINPSTRKFTTLSQPSLSSLQLEGLTMVFDPSKSLHYKLVSVRSNTDDNSSTTHYHLEIYSSETRSWNIASNETFATPGPRHQSFHRGIHWNGAIVWFHSSGESIFFQTEEEEKISSIPELRFKDGSWYDRDFCVGESNDHLYLVETYCAKPVINVYEMENDFSGWVMKYNIDLFEVKQAYPLMLNRLSGGTPPYAFDVLSVVWMDRENSSSNEKIGEAVKKTSPFLVMTMPEKIIRLNLDDERNLIELCDVDIQYCGYHECTRYFSGDMHEYIEGLFTTCP